MSANKIVSQINALIRTAEKDAKNAAFAAKNSPSGTPGAALDPATAELSTYAAGLTEAVIALAKAVEKLSQSGQSSRRA